MDVSAPWRQQAGSVQVISRVPGFTSMQRSDIASKWKSRVIRDVTTGEMRNCMGLERVSLLHRSGHYLGYLSIMQGKAMRDSCCGNPWCFRRKVPAWILPSSGMRNKLSWGSYKGKLVGDSPPKEIRESFNFKSFCEGTLSFPGLLWRNTTDWVAYTSEIKLLGKFHFFWILRSHLLLLQVGFVCWVQARLLWNCLCSLGRQNLWSPYLDRSCSWTRSRRHQVSLKSSTFLHLHVFPSVLTTWSLFCVLSSEKTVPVPLG